MVQEQLELANRCQRLQIEKFEDASSTFVAEDDSGGGWPENADTKN